MQQLKDYSVHITIGTLLSVLIFIAGAIFYVSGVVQKVEANENNIDRVYNEITELRLDLRLTTELTKEINTKLKILLPNY